MHVWSLSMELIVLLNVSFIPKLTVWWKLLAYWINRRFTFLLMIRLLAKPTRREKERERAGSGGGREAVVWSGEHVAPTALSG